MEKRILHLFGRSRSNKILYDSSESQQSIEWLHRGCAFVLCRCFASAIQVQWPLARKKTMSIRSDGRKKENEWTYSKNSSRFFPSNPIIFVMSTLLYCELIANDISSIIFATTVSVLANRSSTNQIPPVLESTAQIPLQDIAVSDKNVYGGIRRVLVCTKFVIFKAWCAPRSTKHW